MNSYDYCPHCHSENRVCDIRMPAARSAGATRCLDCGHVEFNVLAVSHLARDTESHYQALVQDNNRRRDRGLPEFEPSYELAEKIAARGLGINLEPSL